MGSNLTSNPKVVHYYALHSGSLVEVAHPEYASYPIYVSDDDFQERGREIERLRASCEEFLPILERQLESINPDGAAEGSRAYQVAKARVDRMRAALGRVTVETTVT